MSKRQEALKDAIEIFGDEYEPTYMPYMANSIREALREYKQLETLLRQAVCPRSQWGESPKDPTRCVDGLMEDMTHTVISIGNGKQCEWCAKRDELLTSYTGR
jgi:hypothetical protein